ncbi:WAPL (Wings apart-like protein regulation of heterochromatin) protein [Zea mays]|uniref:WAPL (Wings apart-like protein regulation of heterochromatin) protein n=1 Tax=Zea mays TaxID=4577 RepID=A0A1D6KRT7_MAIZE|nr:WAPL (Wings apart-like protein regulation of heterochromatin) protein [Zea mays]
MIVRTYRRRSRSISEGGGGVSSSQEAFDFDADVDVLGSSASQPLPPSQESSSMWDFDEDPPPSPPRPGKEGRRSGRGGARRGGGLELAEAPAMAPTVTLMEAEEYGEMMESVDDVTFALDGLRPAAQKRTRRASLLALLGICDSAERRRVLRSQGLVQQIIDAILVLDIDDPPCAIAAGALLFVLASDVQDNNLLSSETCVHFLLKLLNPPVNVVDAKAPSIGSKLLGISKFQMLNGSNKDVDSCSEDILLKVEEILLSCKEIKPADRDYKRTTRPELCSKWLALLTMEKACLSAVALEDTSDMVLELGGNFKETLRQLGGLDDIFNVMVNCHSELETHLLSMSRKLSPKCRSLSFVGVILNIVELLSALSLLQKPSTVSRKADPKNTKVCNGACSADSRGLSLLNHHCKCNNSKKKSILLNRRCQYCSSTKSEASHVTLSSSSDVSQSERILNCSSFSSNGTSSGSFGVKHINGASLKLNVRMDRSKAYPVRGSTGWISMKAQTSDWNSREMAKKRRLSENVRTDLSNGGDDPFAFDDIDQEPSNWDLFGPKRKSPQKRAKRTNGEVLDDCGTALMGSPKLCQPEDIYQSVATSGSKVVDESNLLEDCLLASVKVLMNLANDNPSGCEQIASCGGLNNMASLIIKHFPSFDFSMNSNNQMNESVSSGDPLSSQNSKSPQIKTKQLRDYELDFLVAILGLLVNLVEKDSLNRVRLANARVSVNLSQNPDSKEVQRDVIPLLCSIFLASQGTGETAEAISPDDEESLLQGEREAEMMIVEAYAALVLAFLSTESMKVRGAISSCLPDNNLKVLVPVLEKFVSFHLQLNMMTRETHSAVTEVIERCRLS